MFSLAAVGHVAGCTTLPLCLHPLSQQVSKGVSSLLRHTAGIVDKMAWAHPHVVLERMHQGPSKKIQPSRAA